MKAKMVVVAALMVLIASTAFAASFFGPAEPAAPAGKFAIGAGYFYYDDKFKNEDTVKFQQNQAFIDLSYGLAPDWEAYLRLGGADAKIKNDAEFSDSMKFYSGLGIRGVLYRFNPQFSIGGNLYFDYVWQDYEDSTQVIEPVQVGGRSYDVIVTEKLKAKTPWSVNLALVAQWMPDKKVVVYGGPKFFYGSFKGEATVTGSATVGGVPVAVSLSDSSTYETKNWIGGVVGVRFAIPGAEQLKFGVETQFTDRWSVGGMLHYSF